MPPVLRQPRFATCGLVGTFALTIGSPSATMLPTPARSGDDD